MLRFQKFLMITWYCKETEPSLFGGWANPNEKITVQFNHQTKKTKADKSGKWMIKLDSESAGGPYQGSDKVFACASQYILDGPTMPEMTTYITKRIFLLRHSEQMIGKG